MRINGTGRPGKIARAKEGARDSATSNVFSISDGEASSGASGAAAAAPIHDISALLALQGVEATGERGARLKHGHAMLDILEDLKLSLLSGEVSATKLQQLVDEVSRRPDRQNEERIEAVLDEIELRARVELAKLGREAA